MNSVPLSCSEAGSATEGSARGKRREASESHGREGRCWVQADWAGALVTATRSVTSGVSVSLQCPEGIYKAEPLPSVLGPEYSDMLLRAFRLQLSEHKPQGAGSLNVGCCCFPKADGTTICVYRLFICPLATCPSVGRYLPI